MSKGIMTDKQRQFALNALTLINALLTILVTERLLRLEEIVKSIGG
jgi:23S rRNA pseudoU1915 N3-methylase RlmH